MALENRENRDTDEGHRTRRDTTATEARGGKARERAIGGNGRGKRERGGGKRNGRTVCGVLCCAVQCCALLW